MHIEDIRLDFAGREATRFAPFVLVAWFYRDVLHLAERLQQVTVARKRNWQRPRPRYPHTFQDADLCLGVVTVLTLGLTRLSHMNQALHDEQRLAEVIGLPRWFDQSTAHAYLNQFQRWHVRQLERVNTDLLRDFSGAAEQSLAVLDVDSMTHSLESKQREGAVPGFNRAHRGKPCYQWFVGSVGEEIIAQYLDPGNTYLGSHVANLMTTAETKLPQVEQWVWRSDSIFCSADTLNTAVQRQWLLSLTGRWNDLVANCAVDWTQWKPYNSQTRLLDVGLVRPLRKCAHPFRVVLAETRQADPGHRKKRDVAHYGIVTNLFANGSAGQIFEFQHDHGNMENVFKQVKNPLSAGKMPSQQFRANEAYLQLVQMAHNSFLWFKKTVCRRVGGPPLLTRLEEHSWNMPG